MKHQIARLSPHQNAKVAAILWALISLLFVVPMFLVLTLTAPPQARHDPLANYFMFALPFIYLIVAYIGVLLVCAIYNFLFRFIGGFEFESREGQ